MTILELAKVSNVNTLFVVRDEVRATNVEIGTAAMVVNLATGYESQIGQIDAKDNAIYITLVK